MKQLICVMASALVCGLAFSAQTPSLIPFPASFEMKSETGFKVTPETTIAADRAFMKEAAYAAAELNRATGFALKAVEGNTGSIVFRKVGGLASEAYRLNTDGTGAVIEAATAAGAFYGFQTLRQLLPVEIFAKTVQREVDWTLPSVSIKDEPRFSWRGVMVDECRHFMGPQAFKEMVDALAAHKMNTLHWHLTEDQAWRIEIKKYPQLVEKGATRRSSPVPFSRNKLDGKPYGPFFYTQDQIRELIAYAADRHVDVVPEIEMPGHAVCALAAFPELSCRGGAFEPHCRWGVTRDIFCAGNDRTFKFLKDVLDEVVALFPSKFIHCGGDEAPKDRWNRCPKCQKRIKDLGLKDSHELQSWFVSQIATYLESKGRHMIGWDEILQGGLAKGAAVMSWRGSKGGINAARMGHMVVMSPNSHVYLDYGQGLPQDPHEYIGGRVTLERVYSLNPVSGIPRNMQKFVLGVQGNLWSEYIWNRLDQQWKAWPRASALSEVAWTPQEFRSWDSFLARAEVNQRRLTLMGIHAAFPLPSRPCAYWNPGDIPTEWTVKEWAVPVGRISCDGTYKVTFTYTGGESRVDIRKVELVVDGKVLASDSHKGMAGYKHQGTVYQLKVRNFPKKASPVLRVEIRTDGNDNSRGEISLSR